MTSRISNWRTPVAAAAFALAIGLPTLDAHALALGRVNVLSALGEPLRAEIEVPEITAEEASSLRASIASGEAFRAAGLEYNPALKTAQVSLQRRSDGRSYLRITSDRPINEPFVDLILETTWSTGRVVRDYTMLFDPSNLRTPAAASATTAPVVSPSAANNAPSTQPVTPRARATVAAPAAARAPRTVEPKTASSQASDSQKPGSVTVKAGNTANQLAAQYKPSGVSLDQMLVAMLSMNPDAFVNGNVNRLKKGVVLELPTADKATGVADVQARQTITAQSKDFNEFRRRLAEGAPSASAPSASRKAAGSVQADVQERKNTTVTPDKLTLSKGNANAAADKAKEEAIAKEKNAKEAAARTAELSKNIQDLNKLNGTPTVASPKPAAPAVASPSSSAVGIAIPAVTNNMPVMTSTLAKPSAVLATSTVPTLAAVSPTSTVTAVITTDTMASLATSTVSPTAVIAPIADVKPVAKATVPAAPQPSFLDGLLDNPMTLPAGAALLALLAGLGVYTLRKRKGSAQVDSSFLESRLQPDSFFGASGGQRVDTNDAPNSAAGSSMVYSPSQLDAAGDVDPVAEADVYLAYGRDLQAEEILKEAMRTTPSRVAIHAKLMEIYAKRRDSKAFESVAREAFAVTKGQGTEWDTAAALGREMDPANPLYQPSSVTQGAYQDTFGGGAGMTAAGLAAVGGTAAVQAASPVGADDVDFDLDFSMGDDLVETPMVSHTSTSPIHVQPTVSMSAQPVAVPSVDLVFETPELPSLANSMAMAGPDMASFNSGLAFSPAPIAPLGMTTAPMAIQAQAVEPAMNALEFDLGDLSLDLAQPGASKNAITAAQPIDAGLTGDPLETKLALAQEFREIGDDDGARSLAQEVAAEAFGALKARAQRMVAELS